MKEATSDVSRPDKVSTIIPDLGPAKIRSHMECALFIQDDQRVQLFVANEEGESGTMSMQTYEFEPAGPRSNLYFDPPKTKCAIVTCGGLCPGINDVIRALVMTAHHSYGVAGILGIRYGLQGFIPEYGHQLMELTPDKVANIHEFGGTILSSSRGPQSPEEIVDALERMNVSVLFLIGGDGTMQASLKIQEEVAKRKIKMAVIGIPKTIDNDINFVPRSFGFDTAVEKATEAIRCAHTEALGAPNGIGMVKLMGREAGFIAAQATLALKDVNFVLIPEDPFEIHGPNGFLQALDDRIRRRGHAVVVVAEGAGQDLLAASSETDASGNPVLRDICGLLRREIDVYFKSTNTEYTLKFIDPSYIIRSIPANANDRVYCGFLGQNAVHAAMAGKTGMVVSKLHGHYIHLPLSLVAGKRKSISTVSNYWQAVLQSTGQPVHMKTDLAQYPQGTTCKI
ncbi:ATP-dependent 6-phosphofructokinase [Desulfonatronum parangueonense]